MRISDWSSDVCSSDLVGTKLFHSIIVHHEAEFPIQVEERFVLASVAPDYGSLDFTQMTPNEYLTRTAPLERVEHRVCAAVPDERIREMLGLPDGEPVLRMTRRTRSEEPTSELQPLMPT